MGLSNAQLDAILREYDSQRLKHQYELDKRVDEVYAKIPDYKLLQESIPTISFGYTQKYIDGDKTAKTELKKELDAIVRKKQELLIQNGFPKNYLEMQYSCELCKDTGYVGQKKCSCLQNKIFSALYNQSNIANFLQTNNFHTLSEEYYSGSDLENFRDVVSFCHDMVDHFAHKKENILFYGNVGVGKSFLSCCVAKELLDKGYSVLYFSSAQLFDVLASSTFDKDSKENLYTTKEDIYNCDLVVIDDLGTELINSFVSSSLFALLNERLLCNKSTIISTNLSLKDLRDMYSDRIFSRISTNYKLCKLSGPDIRIKKQFQ